ncbi:DUF6894 family protein [Methylobacterium sp. R2-1]|uniref:DUF6894 family protein n=1 Tax=Methylobacterium sp. R2-1 TaxID=2587064 RepID=UPI00161FD2EF|nr:hypothetical protein [Methylobacterium sp. R2-1]MBB2962564.1 hypothetical protein [Methylobacterium sp. R2-1]
MAGCSPGASEADHTRGAKARDAALLFHLRYGSDRLVPDPEGEILPGPDAAHAQAPMAAQHLIAHPHSGGVRNRLV